MRTSHMRHLNASAEFLYVHTLQSQKFSSIAFDCRFLLTGDFLWSIIEQCLPNYQCWILSNPLIIFVFVSVLDTGVFFRPIALYDKLSVVECFLQNGFCMRMRWQRILSGLPSSVSTPEFLQLFCICQFLMKMFTLFSVTSTFFQLNLAMSIYKSIYL